MILFFQYDSLQEFKPFEPFHTTQRIEHFFWNMTQWIEFFFQFHLKNWTFFCHSKELYLLFHDAKNWTHFSETQLNTFLFWSTELNILFEHDSQNWTLFLECDSKNWTWFSKFDSKNWTLFTRRQRIEPSSQNDSKNWTFLKILWHQDVLIFLWIKELRPFFNNITQKWLTLFEHDSQNWTFFSTWLTELNPF